MSVLQYQINKTIGMITIYDIRINKTTFDPSNICKSMTIYVKVRSSTPLLTPNNKL